MQKPLYIPLYTIKSNNTDCTGLVKYGDSLELTLKVFDDTGKVLHLTGKTVNLIIKKQDATIYQETLTNITDTTEYITGARKTQYIGSKITTLLDVQATNSLGKLHGELLISDENGSITTNTFTLLVVPNLSDLIIENSVDEIQILSELIEALKEYIELSISVAGTIKPIQALSEIKSYIDTNLPLLQSANSQALTNIANEEIANNEIETAISTATALKIELDDFVAAHTDITNLINTVNTHSEDIEGIDSQLSETAKKLTSIISVLEYGADRDGTNDSTQAFKDAIAYARTTMIANNLKSGVYVEIPAGIYKITDQVIISPFVHIVTNGFVYIQSTVSNKSVFYIANQSGDPSFKDMMAHQQYLRSPIINANNGGMFIQSTLNKESGSIAIEIGTQTNLGIDYTIGRYSLCDIAIDNFDISLQINPYNNYLGKFSGLYIESNNTIVRFGDGTKTTVSNSGENMGFVDCIFGNSVIGFDWYTDGFHCNFYGCSFDFVTTLFKFRRGYKKVSVFGGHVEGVTTIADATSMSDTNNPPKLILESPNALCESTTLFKGNVSVKSSDVYWARANPTLASFLYSTSDTSVNIKETGHSMQGSWDIALSPNLNRINNSKFQSVVLETNAPMNEFVITKSNFSSEIVTATIPTGSQYTRALKSTSTGTSNYFQIKSSNGYSVNQGDVIQLGSVSYIEGSGNWNVSFQAQFLDVLGNVISTTVTNANKTGAVIDSWNTIFGGKSIIAPAGSCSVKLITTFSSFDTGLSFYVGEIFLGIS